MAEAILEGVDSELRLPATRAHHKVIIRPHATSTTFKISTQDRTHARTTLIGTAMATRSEDALNPLVQRVFLFEEVDVDRSGVRNTRKHADNVRVLVRV